ncbi:hypothetical protein MARI_25860 [Marinobacter sp. JH2]|nr:hypothetical protein MARI_25860 [Marinobacter sp. JH2]
MLSADYANLPSATLINAFIVVLVVLMHREALVRLSALLKIMHARHNLRLVTAVLGILIAHTAQVWVFAIAYFLMHHADTWGSLQGNFNGSFLDCVYFSFSTFTTVGYGDIEPVGALRFLTGIEGLTGLVLITWSASFLFMKMQRYWKGS